MAKMTDVTPMALAFRELRIARERLSDADAALVEAQRAFDRAVDRVEAADRASSPAPPEKA